MKDIYIITIKYENILKDYYFNSLANAYDYIKNLELTKYNNKKLKIKNHSTEIIGKYDTYYIIKLKEYNR